MLKITGWSLLLGAAALIAVLTVFYAPPAADPQTPPVTWNPGTAEVSVGHTTRVDGHLQVTLNELGAGVITLAMEPVAARDYAFLHIALDESSENISVALAWPDAKSEEKKHVYHVESTLRASLWIATAEIAGWTGDISKLSLMILGRPGDTVLVRDFSIFPTSPWRQLRAIFSDLTGFKPWNRAAMNTNTGVMTVSSFYPVPLTVALVLLSFLAYCALVAASRGKLRFDRSTAALIFLSSWIILDLFWQKRLWHQLADTYRTFAGTAVQQRQSVGPDAQLVKFVSQIKPQLTAADRVFVASSDHYQGMRVAYYLYPLNVYWSLHAPEVPYDEFLRKGDYIALIRPSTFQFNSRQKFLFAPDRANRPAELVFSDATGLLVRLN